jgi:hypothetical protein
MCFPLETKSVGAWHSAGRPVEVGFSLKLPLVRTKAFSIFYIITRILMIKKGLH